MTRNDLPPRSKPVSAGDLAPDFELLDQDKEPWRLSDRLASGDVVLCFYPLAFTGVCGTEMECITREMARWEAAGAVMVGISCDSFATNKAWAEQMGFKHRLLADMHREVCKGYGLYWADLNCASRGTVVVTRDEQGKAVVKWAQSREPGSVMEIDEVLAKLC